MRATVYSLRFVLKVFAPLPIFFALLFQQNSVWVFQAAAMNGQVGKLHVPPDAMSTVDDALCVVLIPLFDMVLYPLWARRTGGREPPALHKMMLGMVCVTLGYVVCGVLQTFMDRSPAGSVSIAWQIPQYVFVASGEVLVAIPGLEYSYSQAPPALKSLVTSIWMVVNALGSGIIAGVASVPALNDAKATVFFAYAGAMALFLAVFAWLTAGYHYKEVKVHDEEGDKEDADVDTVYVPLL